jgi:hypothetical protein
MPVIEYVGSASSEYTPLPAATYTLQITKVEEGNSRAGNRQVKVEAIVVDGEYEGRKCFLWYSLTPKASWKLGRLLAACGFDMEAISQATGRVNPETGKDELAYSFDTDDLIGQIFLCDVAVGTTPDGKPKNDYDNERAYTKPATKPAAKAVTAAKPAAKAAPAAKAVQQTTMPFAEDEYEEPAEELAAPAPTRQVVQPPQARARTRARLD